MNDSNDLILLIAQARAQGRSDIAAVAEASLAFVKTSLEEGLGAVPAHMHSSVRRYVLNGVPGGHFLTAVLTNDLRGAVEHADDWNVQKLPDWVKFLYNHVPSGAWGSGTAVKNWCDGGGFEGRVRISLEPMGPKNDDPQGPS